MKTTLFLGTCLLLLIVLQLIPYQVNYGNYTIVNADGALPHIFLFFHICLISLAIISLQTTYSFHKPLPEGLILHKKDKHLAPYFRSIAYWATFMVTTYIFRSELHLFSNIGPHFVCIIISVVCYGFICKWFFQKYQPAQLCMYQETIAIRSFLQIKHRTLSHLKGLSYHAGHNRITLHFEDGLNNVNLYLAEYDPAAIKALMVAIQQQKGNTITYNENFVKYFS